MSQQIISKTNSDSSSNSDFLKNFNASFDTYIEELDSKNISDEVSLNKHYMAEEENMEKNNINNIYILSRPLNHILSDTIQAWIDIFDELINGKIKKDGVNILLLNNRLFYVGITLAFISFMLIVYSTIIHYK